jgi:hypothetical protein
MTAGIAHHATGAMLERVTAGGEVCATELAGVIAIPPGKSIRMLMGGS